MNMKSAHLYPRRSNPGWLYTALIAYICISEKCLQVTSKPFLNESLSSYDAPVIGVYRKNFAGKIVQTITEERNSEATLPKLSVEDHIWEGKSLQISCKADYPVKFRYNGPGSPPVHLETFREAPELYNPSSYAFSSTVTFTHTTERQTGNYTCLSIQNPNLLSYVYLFVPGNNIFVSNSETNGSVTLTITPKESDPWVTLPCAVSVNETRVHLFKSASAGVVEELRLNNNSLRYNPKVGFRLKWRVSTGNDPYGKYYCKANIKNKQEKLHMRLAPPKYVLPTATGGSGSATENQLSYFEDPTVGVKEESSIKFHFDSDKKRILCCSEEKSVRPKMVHSRCESVSDCEVRRIYVEHKSCFPKCGHRYTNVQDNCTAYELASYSDAGVIECSIKETMKKYFQFSYNDGILLTDFKKLPRLENVLRLMKENPSKDGIGTYTCLANNFYFSHGLRWGVLKPNLALEILPEERFPAKHEREINESDYTAVYCFAPIWNSPTEWRNVSMVINKN